MKYCFGVDVGGTTIKMGLFKGNGNLVEKWEIVTRKEHAEEDILPDVSSSITEKLDKHHILRSDVLGIGLGIPGPIKEDGTVESTANLGWGYKEVRRELEELTHIEVRTANDANMAALGEMWKGGGAGCRNLVMVTLGTGVGGGIIINGKIVGGSHGAGGEIGHICVNREETESCGCGNYGCLEQYASATGMVRIAKQYLGRSNEDTVLRTRNISAKSVFDAVKEGDSAAVRIAEEFGAYLGHALANVAVIADPDVFVIGGGVSKAGSILLDFIRKPYMEKAFFANKTVEFVLAELGNDAGICGGAKLILG